MATRITISITVLLFLFITLSRARDLQSTLSQSKPQTTTRSKPQQYDTVSFNLNSIDHHPVTLLDLRHINRHVHTQRPLPLEFPLSHRRCRHGHRRQIPYGNDMILANNANTNRRQIPYGNDMIMANYANTKDRRIPKRLSRIHSDDVMFPHVMDLNSPHHIHSQGHHHHEKSWFSKKIHEFLNLF